jgi:hypothetical protein
MSGAFQTSREIFENPIWKNIVDFRLFFLIYGQAVFADEGYRVSEDLHLERGQWCRSLRNLQKDLEYVENRQIKTYSLSVLNRCIKRAVDSQRLCTRIHELGTVFTVVNYEQYQGFANYKNGNLERNLEQSGNSGGTVEEQSGNNNKNVKKEKNAKKVKEEVIKDIYAEKVYLSITEYEKLIIKYGNEDNAKWGIEKLSIYKCSKRTNYTSDYHVLIGWVFDDFEKRKLIVVNGGQFKGKPSAINKLQEMHQKALEDEQREANGGY